MKELEKEICSGNCGMNYCDENGCVEKKRILTEPCESLQPKVKTKEEVWKITAENKFPICYKTGDWDGKQSDLCLCVDIEGKHHLATCYESNREFEWYDKDDFGLRHDVVKWAYVEAMEEYAQSHANKDGCHEYKELVGKLAEWSTAYPRGRIYHAGRKDSMDGELIEIEEKAKELFFRDLPPKPQI